MVGDSRSVHEVSHHALLIYHMIPLLQCLLCELYCVASAKRGPRRRELLSRDVSLWQARVDYCYGKAGQTGKETTQVSQFDIAM